MGKRSGLVTRRDVLGMALAGAAACSLGRLRAAEPKASEAKGAERKAPDYKVGCYTRPFDAWEYRVALDGIAAAGYRYAGLMTAKCERWVIIHADTPVEEAARIGEDVKHRGLEVVSLYAGDFPVATSIEAGIAGLKRLIDNSVACGSPNLMLGGTTDERIFESYYKVVRECCDYAVAKGIGLSVKPHGGQNATGPQLRKIIESVGHRAFRVWYDPGNIFYYSDGKIDPVTDAPSVDGLVAGVSVKDFLPPKEVNVTPGDGRVDFAAVFAALRKGGFVEGPLAVETLAKGELEKITAEARKARAFLEDRLEALRKAAAAAEARPAAGAK